MEEIRTLLDLTRNYFVNVEFPHNPRNPYLVCLHGYASSPASFTTLAKLVQQEFNVICLHLSTFRSTIREMAMEVERTLREREIRNYVLVGHSLGGIIAIMHQQQCSQIRARAVFCVATPLFGSVMAKFGFGPVTAEISHNANILTELRSQLYKIPNLFIVQAEKDWVIPRYNWLGSHVIPESSHCSILNYQELANMVLGEHEKTK